MDYIRRHLLPVKYQSSENTITTKYLKNHTEKTSFVIIETFELWKKHTIDHIMEGILSCLLASLRGEPPNELPIQL
jgi:hypothetical protein